VVEVRLSEVQTDRHAGRQTTETERERVTGALQLRLEGEASTARGRRALVCRLAATRTPGNTGPLELHMGF
jgi:hypothetical protein